MENSIEVLYSKLEKQQNQLQILEKEVKKLKANEYFLKQLVRSYKNGINRDAILFEIENFRGLGINLERREKRIVISMTSFWGRLYDVPYAIYSLMCQTLKPDAIVLWLNEEDYEKPDESLPLTLKKLEKNGLTIRYCKDKRSYTKLVYALQEYSEDIIVTADDDIFYPTDWLEKLYNAHLENPDQIIAHRIHRVKIENGKIAPYTEWKKGIEYTQASVLNFLTGVGGVLYPPHSLYTDVLKDEIYQKYVPMADDIWFWAMAVLNGKKIVNMPGCYRNLRFVNTIREYHLNDEVTLAKQNVDNDYNTIQLNSLLEIYPQLLQICLEAEADLLNAE